MSRDPALLLKSISPRLARNFLERERLRLSRFELTGARVTVLLAPTGFGKTAQLIQWRRDMLAQGGLAFWHTLDGRDHPLRLIRGLAYSAQAACGKQGFDDAFMRWINNCSDPQEATTGWLAEVATLAVEVLLLLDDAYLLPNDARNEVLTYLLGNAPANLHIALSARPTSAIMASGTFSTATVTTLTAADLRFHIDETLAVWAAARGSHDDPETGVKLHELTEGWPLGIQLAIAAVQRNHDFEGLVATATADIRRYFVETLIDQQPAEVVQLLVRMAQFELIHPDLCRAVMGHDVGVKELLRIADEMPLLSRAEDGDWMRLHHVARNALRERLQTLPQSERLAIAERASAWYVAQGMSKEAAEQSYLAGNVGEAIGLVEQDLHQMAIQGRNTLVLAWFQRLSADEIRQHPGFWAPVAWALSMGERHAEAQHLLDLILAQADTTPAQRFEADLIGATVASYAERIDLTAALLTQWPEIPPDANTSYAAIYYVIKATAAVQRGQLDEARLHFTRLAAFERAKAYSPLSSGFADYSMGLSYLCEGRYALAEKQLRPALARAEGRLGRRNSLTCMLASLLAHACWESGAEDDPVALLAGRLVILERHGLCDALMIAYKTLARIGEDKGRQDQALDLLESLRAVGQARGMLRVEVLALHEQIRLHAGQGRGDRAQALCVQLEALIVDSSVERISLYGPWITLHFELARAYAAAANNNLEQAYSTAELAIDLATHLQYQGHAVEARLLRAELLRRQDAAAAQAAYEEAVSMARAGGMVRILNKYPLAKTPENSVAPPTKREAARESINPPVKENSILGAGLLTPKEREVLTLLSRNLSNREIARAMDIGEHTVKWHIKNIFSKLDAGSRKHAVARARMLGLVEG